MKMDLELWFTRLSDKVTPLTVGVVGVLLLGAGYGLLHLLQEQALPAGQTLQQLASIVEQSDYAVNHFQTLADLKANDTDAFKAGVSTIAQSNKALFETGLSLHEEKRLLDKQLEVMTTYLTLDTALQRIFLMRGDQVMESYFIGYVPLKAFAGAPTTFPRVVRITSKERFAHPERGKAEMVDGNLQWEPPQVGNSVRSKALGEYVIFTNSKLMIHGPPKNPIDHESFPHVCLGVSLTAARNLYLHSFIGTKLILPVQKDMVMAVELPLSSSTSPSMPNGN